MSSPFAEATDRLVEALDGATAAPPRSNDEPGVDVTLVGVTPKPFVRHTDRRGHPVELRYLVSAAGAADAAADLLFAAWQAASAAGDLDIEADAVPMDWWPAFGVAPRPAFLVRSTVVVEVPLERAGPAERLVVVHHDDADTERARRWDAGRR